MLLLDGFIMIDVSFLTNKLPKDQQTIVGKNMKYAEEYQINGYTIVRGFIDQHSVKTISMYLENSLNRYPENNQGGKPSDSSKISWYGDPLIEVVLKNSLPEMEQITGHKLFPSYSFTRVYTKGDELKPHIDRPACEVSVTCHIATIGKPWPIWMQAPGKQPSEHFLEPGDACVYHGCEIKHWRTLNTETDINVQVMLHYVRQDGPNAHHKFDQRQNLGLPPWR